MSVHACNAKNVTTVSIKGRRPSMAIVNDNKLATKSLIGESRVSFTFPS